MFPGSTWTLSWIKFPPNLRSLFRIHVRCSHVTLLDHWVMSWKWAKFHPASSNRFVCLIIPSSAKHPSWSVDVHVRVCVYSVSVVGPLCAPISRHYTPEGCGKYFGADWKPMSLRWMKKHENSQRTVPLHFCPWIFEGLHFRLRTAEFPSGVPLKTHLLKHPSSVFSMTQTWHSFLFQSNSCPFSPTVPFFQSTKEISSKSKIQWSIYTLLCPRKGGGGISNTQQWTKRSKKNGQCH